LKVRQYRCLAFTTWGLILLSATSVHGALELLGTFATGLNTPVGIAYDQISDAVWVYRDSGADIRQYSPSGMFLSSVPRPGESADDFDLEIAPEALSLAGTPLPAGTLLAINGENGAAEIYALDKMTGAVLAVLNTAFGLSHVVGGAYHPHRDTFFLVQDRQPSGSADDSLVAEIDPSTGAVLNTFKIDEVLSGYTINFGDVEVNAFTGNLLFVSSDETPLAEFAPAGTFVQLVNRPAGLSSLSGIGLNDAAGEAWVSGTGGSVWRLGGLPPLDGDYDLDTDVDGADFLKWQAAFGSDDSMADGNDDGIVDGEDLQIWIDHFGETGAVAAVPEPTAGWLVVGGLSLAALKRRSRPVVPQRRWSGDGAWLAATAHGVCLLHCGDGRTPSTPMALVRAWTAQALPD
jgi:hypothetical protein